MKRIIIIGATSGIGQSLAEYYAQGEVRMAILGRREENLNAIAALYPTKFVSAVCDITDVAALPSCLDSMVKQLGGLDLFILSSGVGTRNPELLYEKEEPALLTNVVGWTCAVDWAMNFFERQQSGHLVTISSVAGTRGNAVAPAYSASKAFQISYMEGMRQKAHKSRGRISTTDVRPGFVDTAMGQGPKVFWVASVEKAVKQIAHAIERRQPVVYITKRWRWVAWVFKRIPNFIYYRLG
ncbi:MAG: SDR family NAD(P)-dependent oxidoreductase [Phocaeicola sp.]